MLAFCKYDGQSLQPIECAQVEELVRQTSAMPMASSWLVGDTGMTLYKSACQPEDPSCFEKELFFGITRSVISSERQVNDLTMKLRNNRFA